jgi:hypothetical protein
MNFSREGYDGTLFADFHVRQSSSDGPGWFIFGRDKNKYGVNVEGRGCYVLLCGFVRCGRARNYNGEVRIGWRTKREAQAALDAHLQSYPWLSDPSVKHNPVFV